MRDKHEFVFFSISSFKYHAFLDTAKLFVPVLDSDYTFPDKFWSDKFFTCMQPVYTEPSKFCYSTVWTSQYKFLPVSALEWLFLTKARNYVLGLCKNLHGSGVVKEEPYQLKILTYFWSGQILTVIRASFQRVAPPVLL